MIFAVVPIELVVGDPDLLLDAQVLVPHVLDLNGDVTPSPLEWEVDGVLEVVDGVDMVSNGLELFLSGLKLGQGAGIEQVGVFVKEGLLFQLRPLLPLHHGSNWDFSMEGFD